MYDAVNFNKIVKQDGRVAGRVYCAQWATSIKSRSDELTAMRESNKMEETTYNMKHIALEKEMKELDKCVATVNK